MKSIKLFCLAILILTANVAIVNAQENETNDDKILNEINEAQRLHELPRRYEPSIVYKNYKISKKHEENILMTLPPETKSKMLEIKKLDEVKYYRLLDQFNFGNSPDLYKQRSSITKKNFNKEKLLEIDVQLLALKYKNADTASKFKIKEDLTAMLSDLFDIREAKKREEIKRLENRLEKLNESLEAREINKDIIIERRIQELFGNSDYLEW